MNYALERCKIMVGFFRIGCTLGAVAQAMQCVIPGLTLLMLSPSLIPLAVVDKGFDRKAFCQVIRLWEGQHDWTHPNA